jgi:hypothetical protein|uniref:Uncharacterized protein n=1 Tax=uncultured virus TaxID=340016 RepID=D5L299_9VIRU|nr:hypothetical protein [uncultured virus]
MQEELRKRRDETFEMLVVKGYDYSRVVTTLADRYDVVPSTIETDINRMSDWLPHLSHYDDDNGQGKLRELQKNRQRLHQLATEARQDGERLEELKIRRHIDKSVETETELAQSLGAMHEEPDEVQVDGDMSVVEMLSGEQDDD